MYVGGYGGTKGGVEKLFYLTAVGGRFLLTCTVYYSARSNAYCFLNCFISFFVLSVIIKKHGNFTPFLIEYKS